MLILAWQGEKGNPNARCDFFQWADKRDRAKRVKSDSDGTEN